MHNMGKSLGKITGNLQYGYYGEIIGNYASYIGKSQNYRTMIRIIVTNRWDIMMGIFYE